MPSPLFAILCKGETAWTAQYAYTYLSEKNAL